MPTQTEQSLAVRAEGGQGDGDGSAVWPDELIPFVSDAFFDTVADGFTTEKHSQGAGHPSLSSWKGQQSGVTRTITPLAAGSSL